MKLLRPLIDRERELRALDAAWRQAQQGCAQLVILSGHRRVGKTYLLWHFLQRLDVGQGVYYGATQQAEHVELRLFGEALRESLGEDAPLVATTGIPSWETALRAAVDRARDRSLVVVIDEAPYLTRSTPGFASIVQQVWDRLSSLAWPVRLLLVLTGSAVSVMESMVGPDGPLRGRVRTHLRVQPFDLPTVATVLGTAPEPAIEAYAAIGGWPQHLAEWDPGSPLEVNLHQLAGQAGGALLENAERILGELPDGPGFGRVLTAIGRGRTKRGDIHADAGQRIEYPVNFLVDSGLVRRDTPVNAPRRVSPEYSIADPYLRFWFNVVYPGRDRIYGGQGVQVLANQRERWRQQVGWVFEEAARAHARRLVRDGVLHPETVIGRWWASSRGSVEVDVLGAVGNRTVLIGEATWSSGRLGRAMISRLEAHRLRVPNPSPDLRLFVWTRAYPEPAFRRAGVRIFEPSDVLQR